MSEGVFPYGIIRTFCGRCGSCNTLVASLGAEKGSED